MSLRILICHNRFLGVRSLDLLSSKYSSLWMDGKCMHTSINRTVICSLKSSKPLLFWKSQFLLANSKYYAVLSFYHNQNIHCQIKMEANKVTIQGRRKLIFTGPAELVGLGWGFEKQVFKVTVLLEYFDLTGLIMQPGASSKMGLRANGLKFPPTSLLAPLLLLASTILPWLPLQSGPGQSRTSRSGSYSPLQYRTQNQGIRHITYHAQV